MSVYSRGRRRCGVVSQCLPVGVRHLPRALLRIRVVPVLAPAFRGVFLPGLVRKGALRTRWLALGVT